MYNDFVMVPTQWFSKSIHLFYHEINGKNLENYFQHGLHYKVKISLHFGVLAYSRMDLLDEVYIVLSCDL